MNAAAPVRYPLFVVGMPRSGTTLLSAMLDAHPNLAISPETHFYTRCRPPAGQAQSVEAMWECLQQQPGFGDARFRDAEVARMETAIREAGRRRPSGRPQPADVLAAMETVYADRAGAEAWGEKTPDHLPHVPTILDDFPEAVVLAIVRDPRDVCRSLQGLPWNHDTLVESAWTWRRYAERTEAYRVRYPRRVRQVRYEDLVATPEDVIRDVLTWLEADRTTDVVDAVLRFHEREGGPADAEREPWKANTHRPIDPSNREKWRGAMPPAERWIVQRLAGPWLTDLGYDAPPVRVTAAFWRSLAAVLVRTARTLATRLARRLRTASRVPDDYTPAWIRQRENASAEETSSHGASSDGD